jgi:integrase
VARKLARKARAEVDQGIDVAAARQEARADAKNTVQALVEEWYAREIKARHQHPAVVRRVLDNDILPALGRTQCAKITPRQCDAVLRRIVDRGAPTTANKALRYMNRAFRYGRKRRYLEYNPVADFTVDDAGGKTKPRTRALSTDELRTLFKTLRETSNLGRDHELTFKILLATCVRKSELISARWTRLISNNASGTFATPRPARRLTYRSLTLC